VRCSCWIATFLAMPFWSIGLNLSFYQ
jgi:hypothetical protein